MRVSLTHTPEPAAVFTGPVLPGRSSHPKPQTPPQTRIQSLHTYACRHRPVHVYIPHMYTYMLHRHTLKHPSRHTEAHVQHQAHTAACAHMRISRQTGKCRHTHSPVCVQYLPCVHESAWVHMHVGILIHMHCMHAGALYTLEHTHTHSSQHHKQQDIYKPYSLNQCKVPKIHKRI